MKYAPPSTVLDQLVQLLSIALVTEIDVGKPLHEHVDDEALFQQLQKRIRRRFSLDDALDFTTHTIADLARHISTSGHVARSDPAFNELKKFRPVEGWRENEKFPLPPGMMGMWFLYAWSPRTTEYLLPNIVEILAPVSPDVMEKAWQYLVDRHAALRSVYNHDDGVPYFTVRKQHQLDFSWHDATKWESVDFDNRLKMEASRPFDLTKRPPIRICLFKRSDESNYLLIVGHHIVWDFASFVTILQELDAIYPALAKGEDIPNMAPADDLRDYVYWHKERMDLIGEKQWRHWSKELRDIKTMPDLPTDKQRPTSFPHRGASFRFGSKSLIVPQLKVMAQRHNCTLYAVLVTALMIALAKYCGTENPVLTSLMNGRTKRELQSVIGYLVNPVILSGKLNNKMTLSDAVEQISTSVKLAFANQDFPFQQVVENLSPERREERPPFQQTLFVLQLSEGFEQNSLASIVVGDAHNEINIGELPLKGVYYEDPHVQFDLTVAVTLIDGRVKGVLKYSQELFDEAFVNGFADDYLHILKLMADNPNSLIGSLHLSGCVNAEYSNAFNDIVMNLEHTFNEL